MKFSENILYNLSKRWPSPMKKVHHQLGENPESESYLINYAQKIQFDARVRRGIQVDIRDKTVLEIGCGHGGISAFIALNGAKKVIGIDLNTQHLEIARKFAQSVSSRFGSDYQLPTEFVEMNAYDMQFEPESFDIVFADNVFEHFMEPAKVLEQSNRVLKPGGIIVVPSFSSIWSKNALHLKSGLKVPWANLFFSEQTICNVMIRLAKEDPNIAKRYPGVSANPKRVRDLRRHKDLNDITFSKFKKMAEGNGFKVKNFQVYPTPAALGKMLSKVPVLKNSRLVDIFSIYASSILIKQ